MNYEKQTWQTGDIITAEKLNHIEDGIVNKTGKIEIYDISTDNNNGVAIRASYSDLQKIISNGFIPFFIFVDVEHGERHLICTLSDYGFGGDNLYHANFISINNNYDFTSFDAESEMVYIEK